jgi:hypothetical protein
MQSSPAPPARRRCLLRTTSFAASLLLSVLAPGALCAQVEPDGLERLPAFIPPSPTPPIVFEADIFLAPTDKCTHVVTTGAWRIDLVCSDGVPLWRVRGPFRGAEIRSQVALPRPGWTRVTVRSDGVHTAELYVDGEDVRNLSSTFSTWPAAWPASRDFLRRHLDEHGIISAPFVGHLGAVRVRTGEAVVPGPATLAFDSAAAAFAVADAAAVLRVRAQRGRGLLLQVGLGAVLFVTASAVGLYWWSSAEPMTRRVR